MKKTQPNRLPLFRRQESQPRQSVPSGEAKKIQNRPTLDWAWLLLVGGLVAFIALQVAVWMQSQ